MAIGCFRQEGDGDKKEVVNEAVVNANFPQNDELSSRNLDWTYWVLIQWVNS